MTYRPILFQTQNAEQTMRFGEALSRYAKAGDVITLDGELGAGKTQFVRGFSQALGVDQRAVSSPTFVIVHEYESTDRPSLTVVHVDAYRIDSADDLQSIGWDMNTQGSEFCQDAIVLIEWSKRIKAFLPKDRLAIELTHLGDHSREIELIGHGKWNEQLKTIKQELEHCGEFSD